MSDTSLPSGRGGRKKGNRQTLAAFALSKRTGSESGSREPSRGNLCDQILQEASEPTSEGLERGYQEPGAVGDVESAGETNSTMASPEEKISFWLMLISFFSTICSCFCRSRKASVQPFTSKPSPPSVNEETDCSSFLQDEGEKTKEEYREPLLKWVQDREWVPESEDGVISEHSSDDDFVPIDEDLDRSSVESLYWA